MPHTHTMLPNFEMPMVKRIQYTSRKGINCLRPSIQKLKKVLRGKAALPFAIKGEIYIFEQSVPIIF